MTPDDLRKLIEAAWIDGWICRGTLTPAPLQVRDDLAPQLRAECVRLLLTVASGAPVEVTR